MWKVVILIPFFIFFISCSNSIKEIDFLPDSEPVDVVVIAGQSNAEGVSDCSLLTDCMDPVLNQGIPDTWIIYKDVFTNRFGGPTPVKKGLDTNWPCFGPELGLAYSYYMQNKKVVIIKYSYSGMPINCFVKSGALVPEFSDYLRQALNCIKTLGYRPEVKAVCWMQGETDASNYSYLYRSREEYLIKDLRRILGEDILFVDAEISDWKLVDPICFEDQVNHAKYLNCLSHPKNYLIQTKKNGLIKGEDKLHYSADSEFKLGCLFADVVLHQGAKIR